MSLSTSAHPAWLQLFLDTPVADFDAAVGFWSTVTGWRPSARRGGEGQFLTLLPDAGTSYVRLQAVAGPPRVHLDLDSTDRPAAVARARTLGATTAWVHDDVEVMRSAGGFLFCHTLHDPTDGTRIARDGSTILDQVCLDIPDDRWDAEVDFWQEVTGRDLQQATAPGFARLVADGQPRILLQRLGEAGGVVRAHPDLATADRSGDTARHAALGAVVIDVREWWTVLRAPGGQVYCLTDRDPATGSVLPR
jgi:catechol 2,3-dioxygenase-like lactoylglutathione lyase family enzyme